jgi:hypothetical protein
LPLNGMNVGTDYLFQYYDGNTGALVQMGDIQTIKVTGQKHDIATRPYNGLPRYGYVPDGYKVDFTITRNVATLELLMVTFSTNFQAGALMRPGVLNETINNWDGSVSRFQYTNFVVYLTDHGDISREKTVTIKFEGMASDKIAIA